MCQTVKISELEEFLKTQLKDNQKIVYQYSGIFDRDTITKQVQIINQITKQYPQAQRKLFYVYIELAQNVGYYSDDRESIGKKSIGKGSVIIFESSETIGFTIGNLINNKAFEVLKKKCEIINGMTREELRQFKRQQRNLIPGTNGNAHIGLIMVALTTRSPLKIFHKKLDEKYSYFSIFVEVPKS